MSGSRFQCLVLLQVAIMTSIRAFGSELSPDKVLVAPVGEVTVFRPAGTPRAVFVAVHGIQSNQTWYGRLGEELAHRGFAVWAYTRPNAILRPGESAIADADSWELWIDQLETVGKRARVPNVPLMAMGVSWGARPVLASVALHPGLWNGAVVLNPALKTRKDINFLIGAFLSGAPFLRLGTFAIPLTTNDYTNNPSTINHWLSGGTLTKRCTNRFFGRTVALRQHADHRLADIQRPVLALLGGEDNLVPHDAVEKIFIRATNPRLTVSTVKSGTHCMILEKESPEIADQIENWTGSFAKNNR